MGDGTSSLQAEGRVSTQVLRMTALREKSKAEGDTGVLGLGRGKDAKWQWAVVALAYEPACLL